MSDTPEPNDAAPCSAVPLRWRVRWFIRGMGSILVPITIEELRREVDQCVDEQMKKWREENPAPPVRYTGHVPCRKCGQTHWVHGACPPSQNAESIHPELKPNDHE